MHVGLPERTSRLQHILPFILTIFAFLLASLGQQYLNERVHEELAVALFVLAIALTLIAFLQIPEEREKAGLPASRWSWQGALALLISALPACIASALLVLNWSNLPKAVPLYALSLGAAAYDCYRWERWSLPRPLVPEGHWRELVLVALVLACGLFLRLYRLDYYPPPGSISWNDEAQMGKDAYGIVHHGYLPWQFPTSVYATFLSFKVLGPSVLALRLPFVLLGFLTLILFYLLARELFRFPVALAATFLFAVSRWHIAFVRLVLPSTPAMLFEVTTFYLLLRGRRTGGMMNYILAGLTMGLGLYSHACFRIVPFLVMPLFIGQARASWRSGGEGWGEGLGPLGRGCNGWLPFVASTILLIAPLVAIVRREPYRAFGERFAAVTPVLFAPDKAAHLETVRHHAQRALGFFNYVGEAWGAVNLPDLPMLDPWSGALFALGLGYCLFYCWRNRHPFYLVWFFITLIGGGVLTIDFRSHRFAGVLPVLFIFAAIFIERAWAAFRHAVGPSKQRCFAFILLPVLLLAAHANYDIFFYHQIDDPSVRIEFTREVSAIANYMASLGEGHYYYLFANHGYYSTGMDFAWMAGEPPGERGLDILDSIPSHREAGDEELVYIFSTPYNVDALTQVASYFYPEALIKTFEGEYERYTFIAAHVGAEEARDSQGLVGRYYVGYDHSGEPELVRQDTQLSFDWQWAEPPLPFPFSVEWEGTIYAPEWGTYAFESEAIGQVQVYVDEQALSNGEEITLVKGWHAFQVVYESEEDKGSFRLLWIAPRGGKEVVPPGFLSPKTEVNGLLVTHYEDPDWMGQPVERSIEPIISLLGMPTAWQSALVAQLAGKTYSLDCQGQLKVERDGSHRFQIEPWNGVGTLYLDGKEILTVAGTRTRSGTEEVGLRPGWHDLQLRYSYHGGEFSGVQLFWTQPEGYSRIIPPTSLRPPSSP